MMDCARAVSAQHSVATTIPTKNNGCSASFTAYSKEDLLPQPAGDFAEVGGAIAHEGGTPRRSRSFRKRADCNRELSKIADALGRVYRFGETRLKVACTADAVCTDLAKRD